MVLDCINRGDIYESRYSRNCVFVGRDEYGKVKFAAMRGTLGDFKQDAEGSDKKYGFIIPPNDPHSSKIAVFEAPVDCLSHQTLCKQGFIPEFDGWRLSLGGTSILALEQFLKHHSEITHCIICTDSDKAGEEVAAKIAELSGVTVTRSPPVFGRDWNDTLCAYQKAKRSQNRLNSTERS